MSGHKPKHVILQEFTKILHTHNPMGLPLDDMPDKGADEYGAEALSALSRFTESALHLCPDGSMQREIAVGIVRQVFEFWFNEIEVRDVEKLAFELLDAYNASYPQPEQRPAPEVPSEP